MGASFSCYSCPGQLNSAPEEYVEEINERYGIKHFGNELGLTI